MIRSAPRIVLTRCQIQRNEPAVCRYVTNARASIKEDQDRPTHGNFSSAYDRYPHRAGTRQDALQYVQDCDREALRESESELNTAQSNLRGISRDLEIFSAPIEILPGHTFISAELRREVASYNQSVDTALERTGRVREYLRDLQYRPYPDVRKQQMDELKEFDKLDYEEKVRRINELKNQEAGALGRIQDSLKNWVPPQRLPSDTVQINFARTAKATSKPDLSRSASDKATQERSRKIDQDTPKDTKKQSSEGKAAQTQQAAKEESKPPSAQPRDHALLRRRVRRNMYKVVYKKVGAELDKCLAEKPKSETLEHYIEHTLSKDLPVPAKAQLKEFFGKPADVRTQTIKVKESRLAEFVNCTTDTAPPRKGETLYDKKLIGIQYKVLSIMRAFQRAKHEDSPTPDLPTTNQADATRTVGNGVTPTSQKGVASTSKDDAATTSKKDNTSSSNADRASFMKKMEAEISKLSAASAQMASASPGVKTKGPRNKNQDPLSDNKVEDRPVRNSSDANLVFRKCTLGNSSDKEPPITKVKT